MNKNYLNLNIIIAFVLVTLFVLAGGRAFDESMDNKDVMLCNSAKVSGNEEYLKKCSCFYGGEDVRCIYGGQE